MRDIPEKYAILSHRWGVEEVTFKDLTDGTSKGKAGYSKIQFCGEQAKRDGLQYFWVDTCCIDKTNAVELQEAINSMFRWYQHATRCYVYMPDVSWARNSSADEFSKLWESSFRKSEWFTRGWTLQELIAPVSVEFFSKERRRLGNKASLEWYICEITGIPAKALRGDFSDFSVVERISWAASRETFRQEDKAYSLLGIFDVNMPLIYGEGKDKAMQRLREEIEKTSKGYKRKDFSVTFSLLNVSDIEYFVAREDELSKIHKILQGDGSRRTVTLEGLGGIGKTQLSIAYTKRYKDNYSAIFWLNIKDKDSLKQSFVKVAKQILQDHPLASRLSNIDTNGNLDEVVDAVKTWLSLPNNTRWLIVYDNYDNPKVASNAHPAAVNIHEFLPESYQGSVIITTRSSQVGFGHPIRLRKLENMEDCLMILSNTSRREGLTNDPDARKLAEELDGFPLALATAGAYLNEVSISFADYLQLYKESWMKLQEKSPVLGSYEDRTLHSTWQISFDHIEQRNPLSAKLLRLWAYFDNQDLWFELLQHSSSEDPEWVQELTADELSFHDAIRVLSNHGLVEVATSSVDSIESKGYSIHACVHSWTIHILNQDWDFDLAGLAVMFALGAEHISTLNTVNNLGSLYADQGKLAAAESMYEQALAGKEKTLGAEHISTLDTVNNLGILYANQGKLAAAESMYERALAGYEKALGTEHILTLDTVNNLGRLYTNQGKLAAAESMYERALAGYKKAVGEENITTYIPALNTVWGLGSVFETQADIPKARIMYIKAFAGYRKVVGPDHPQSQKLRDKLGTLDAHIRDKALAVIDDSKRSKETTSKSKRFQLFRKLGLR
ncbi:hypothetical protein CJF31_00006831 [Rutstroemia sp. NJR-2017a BVV2]|nr:hypothetical protein CJF31_00006831 [Rutstroemia sp. NJR-2017a BVV2]